MARRGPGDGRALGHPARPPHAVSDVEQERGDEDASHDERVDEDAERDDETDLGQATSGSTPRTRNVPASTTPALVMTPPVTARLRSVASCVPWEVVSSRIRAVRKM